MNNELRTEKNKPNSNPIKAKQTQFYKTTCFRNNFRYNRWFGINLGEFYV